MVARRKRGGTRGSAKQEPKTFEVSSKYDERRERLGAREAKMACGQLRPTNLSVYHHQQPSQCLNSVVPGDLFQIHTNYTMSLNVRAAAQCPAVTLACWMSVVLERAARHSSGTVFSWPAVLLGLSISIRLRIQSYERPFFTQLNFCEQLLYYDD